MNNVLITGSANRIGASIARAFAQKKWNVGIHYHTSKTQADELVGDLRRFGTTIESFGADFTKEEEIVSLLHSAKKEFGTIDLLISTVGIFPTRMEIKDISLSRFIHTFQLNVFSHFKLISEYSLIEEKGRIITFGSIGSKKILQNRIDYTVSKNAVIRLSETFAKELSPNFQVNCICPGAIVVGDETEEKISQMGKVQSIPMKKYGTTTDIVEAVEFFANCTPFITGQTLYVDGGQSL